MSDVAFARAGETQIAYRVVEGDTGGDLTIVMVCGALFPIEALWEEPGVARFLDGLAGFGRLVVFDRRGIGQSDPIVDWETRLVEQWSDDLRAVVEATCADPPVVFAWDNFGVGRDYAARHPDGLSHLILFNPAVLDPASQARRTEVRELADRIDRNVRREDSEAVDLGFPSRAGDQGFRRWLERAGRIGASPAIAQRIWTASFDQGALTPSGIVAPTLVLHSRATLSDGRQAVRSVVQAVPHATVVEAPSDDLYPITGNQDAILGAISSFLTGEVRLPEPERTLAAVLFSDIVGSTERAAQVGDERWRSMLDAHDRTARSCVARCGGTVVKHTGDGVLAVFGSASRALRAARVMRDELAVDGVPVRIGVHVGDVDHRGDDVSGIAVHVAARVMAAAERGGIVVSESVRLATVGAGLAFVPLGSRALKGVPGEWELFGLEA